MHHRLLLILRMLDMIMDNARYDNDNAGYDLRNHSLTHFDVYPTLSSFLVSIVPRHCNFVANMSS